MNQFDPKNKHETLNDNDLKLVHQLTRRNFITYSAEAVGLIYLGTLNTGCAGGGSSAPARYSIDGYAIDSKVMTTAERVLSFAMPAKISGPNSNVGLCPTELPLASEYSKYGYGNYAYGGALPVEQRFDIMPSGYNNSSPVRLKQFANFFAITDVHITDKEAPNQLICLQQEDSIYGAPMTSIYSPVMLYSTQVLDAAIQTINALHKKNPFDFGISLGDMCNSAQYNELRWYLDVLDGNVIKPSSGAHLGLRPPDKVL